MTTVAVIPARGGSKGLPGKNLQLVGSEPLVGRAVAAAVAAETVDEVYVSTDDDEIARVAHDYGAEVIRRPAEIAGDTASSESALVHALDQLAAGGGDPAVLVFVQCTSPFIDPDALDRAVQRVRDGRADSVFAAVESYDFVWRLDDEGRAFGVNHDHATRPRRQDRRPDLVETGAFYVLDVHGFRQTGHRFFGRVEAELVDRLGAFEVDEPQDLGLVRAIHHLVPRRRTTAASRVEALVMDFDGVHTDDHVLVDQDGRESVRTNRSDGHGIKLLREAGIELLILSTETNPVVRRRADKLQIECRQGFDDKLDELQRWLAAKGLTGDQAAYIGNDVNDLACMQAVGFPVAVADAHPAVRDVANHVTSRNGGRGAVRELADLLLEERDAPQLTTRKDPLT